MIVCDAGPLIALSNETTGPAPRPLCRVSVIGSSGSGKTTVAREVAGILGVPHVELDALYWGPGWVEATPEELASLVEDATSGDGWVVDGNYQSKIGTLVWERADTVVWVNPPRWRAMTQVTLRVVRRVVTRQQLWNGNRESWRGLRFWSASDSVIRWAWDTYRPQVERYEAAMADESNGRLRFVRLRSRRDVRRFLADLRER